MASFNLPFPNSNVVPPHACSGTHETNGRMTCRDKIIWAFVESLVISPGQYPSSDCKRGVLASFECRLAFAVPVPTSVAAIPIDVPPYLLQTTLQMLLPLDVSRSHQGVFYWLFPQTLSGKVWNTQPIERQGPEQSRKQSHSTSEKIVAPQRIFHKVTGLTFNTVLPTITPPTVAQTRWLGVNRAKIEGILQQKEGRIFDTFHRYG